jgi:outer membrane lipoprotein LolB
MSRHDLKWILAVISLICLAGCASISPSPLSQDKSTSFESRTQALTPIQTWNVKGLIAIRTAKNAYSANWNWQQITYSNYKIELFGPLGAGAVQLIGRRNFVMLHTSDGKEFTATHPESLLEQQLGWRLPVSYLYYWIRGLPVPAIPAEKHFDAYHHLSLLIQDGWRVDYPRYTPTNGIDLPNKMILTHPDITVKIIINRWQL